MIYPATSQIHDYLENHQIRSRMGEAENLSVVEVSVNGKNISGLTVLFMSSSERNDVTVRTSSLVRVPEDRTQAVLQIINECHQQYRYLRFLLNNHRDLIATYDCPQSLTAEQVGPAAQEMLVRFVSIIDQCYPQIMKACFSEFVL